MILWTAAHQAPLSSTISHSIQFSHSVVFDSLWPHGVQHARLPCPSTTLAPIFWSLLKFMSIELVMIYNYLIFCHLLFLLPSIFPSISIFSNELALSIRRPKYWSFSFSLSPSNECSRLTLRLTGLISLQFKGLKNLLQHHNLKASVLWWSAFFYAYFIEPINSWLI